MTKLRLHKPRSEKAKLVIKLITENPHMRNIEVAEAAKVHPAYVSNLRSRYDLGPFRAPDLTNPYRPFKIVLSEENFDWLYEEAERLNVSQVQLIELIITDARIDAQTEGTIS